MLRRPLISAIVLACVLTGIGDAAGANATRLSRSNELVVLAIASPQADPATQPSAQTLASATTDVHFTVTWLDYTGQYRLQIQSLTGLGTVTALDWTPPPNLIVTAITDNQGASCTVAPSGAIDCLTNLLPRTCEGDTCYPSKNLVIVKFTAALSGNPPDGTFADLFWESYLQVTGLTPIPPTYTDLPLCTKGHPSSKRHPCLPK